MIFFLARRNLLRNRARTVLLWLGISVSGALLYDMVMLSGGLRPTMERWTPGARERTRGRISRVKKRSASVFG